VRIPVKLDSDSGGKLDTEFTVQIVPGQGSAIEDWGRIRKAFI
jgi:hypothetical protein